MEGQGKRLLVAVALALVVMLLWNMLFPSEEKPPDPTLGSGSGATAGALKIVAKTGVCYAPETPEAEPRDPKATPADDVRTKLEFAGKFTAEFSTINGALVSWKLADPRFHKKTEKTGGEMLAPKFVGDNPEVGAFQVGFWKDGDTKRCLPKRTVWTLERKTDTEIVYSWPPKGSAFSQGVRLEKTFTIVPDAYSVSMKVKETVTDLGDKDIAKLQLVVSTFAWQDPSESSEGSMQVMARVWNSSTLRDGEIVHTTPHELKENAAAPPQPRREPNITWTGFEHPYLLAAYAPRRRTPAEVIDKHTLPIESQYGLMRTDIKFGLEPIDAKTGHVEHEVIAYLGPKNYNQLEQADSTFGFTEFTQTVDLGWFAFIGRPLMWLLFKFQSVVINWGLAIMLLTVLVKCATLYWTTKSMRSMKAMAALAPQMKLLQEKYKDDRQRIQAETMALYKQHNVNPIAGCLPILLQMPIWIALYRMLSSAGELYQQPFITGWIDDLTDTDPYHVLPVILVATMFVQAKLSPSGGDSRQQKMMQYGLPLMFGVMSFFFPAGLTLYIFTNTCLSAVHSIYMNKYDKKSLEIMARMKKNAEAATAASKATATPGKKSESAKKVEPVRNVIDAVSTEKDDSDDEERADAGGSASSGTPARQRPRRKKRRR